MISKADNKELEEAIKSMQKLKIEIDNIFYALHTSNPKKGKERTAIGIVLKELKRLQEENSYLKLKERNRCVGRYGEIEIHELINKTLLEDYIEKDKIREKIEELIKKLDKIYNLHGASDYDFIKIEAKIQVLEELLEGK